MRKLYRKIPHHGIKYIPRRLRRKGFVDDWTVSLTKKEKEIIDKAYIYSLGLTNFI